MYPSACPVAELPRDGQLGEHVGVVFVGGAQVGVGEHEVDAGADVHPRCGVDSFAIATMYSWPTARPRARMRLFAVGALAVRRPVAS
jgi:hypothetical protein